MPEKEPKTLSYQEFRNIFAETATSYWMKTNGMDMFDPNTSPYELDESNPDSQISTWKETSLEAFDLFIETLAQVQESGYEVDFSGDLPEQNTSDDLLSDYISDNFGNGGRLPQEPTSKRSSAVTKSNAVFIFMETPSGQPTYVGDVREWLAEVDSLGIPDSNEVEGQLHLSFDTEFVTGERSECLTCGNEEDILMTVHDCPGEPNNA